MTMRDNGKREYRVKETWQPGAESITLEPNYPATRPEVNVDAMSSLFSKSKVFTDQKIAEGYAIRMVDAIEERGGICEYGVVKLDHPTVRFPKMTRLKPGADEWQDINDVPDRLLHRTGFI